MKHKLLTKLLFLSALLGGVNSAWAQNEVAFKSGNTIGATDNSDGWYGGKSEIIEIPANKTLTMKFKTYSATDEQLKGKGANGTDLSWGAYMSHVIQFWTGDETYGSLFWRADGYGWWGDNNTNGSGWFTFLGANTRWGLSTDEGVTYDGQLLREDLTGSDVVLTVQRVGAELRITQDFTATSGKYRRYFVVNYGPSDGSIWSQLAIERAHVDVTEDYSLTDTEDPAITGTQIGLANNTTAFWTAWSDYFTIKPEGSLILKYKVYTNRVNNWNGAVAYVTTDADRGATGYTEYFGLRPDNYVNVTKVNAASTNYDQISWNWATFREKVDGSTATLTITRSGATVQAREEFAPADGSTTLYEEYSQACGDGTQNIRVFIAADGAHLDLLPATKNITSAGWATYCSPYALDFTGSIANLDAAYFVTGNTGNTLELTQISQVVPAGTGVLLKGTGDCLIPIKGAGTDVASNKLIGVTEETADVAAGIYVLMNESKGVGFYKTNNAFTVGANSAYLPANAFGSQAREFLGFDTDVTGIESVSQSGFSFGDFFDLQGRRVAQPQKGLYIVNGKKVVVK